MSTNFEFLKVETETAFLFETANFAEQNYTQGDFEGTLTKTRKIAESAAKLILKEKSISLPERSTFSDCLRKVKSVCLEQDIIDAFYDIKGTGNHAAHEMNAAGATKENALKALNQLFVVLVWFIHKYVDSEMKTAYLDFLEPEAEKLYQTAERKLIYVQSGDWPQYNGYEKIGDAVIDDFEIDATPNSEDLKSAAKHTIHAYMNRAGVPYTIHWAELAWSRKVGPFRDYQVHEVLKRSGYSPKEFGQGNEYYPVDVETAKAAIKAVKEGHSALQAISEPEATYEITLRPEQKDAVSKTKRVFASKNSMLWNAKMRFGKTLSSLQLIKDEQYQKVLIMTHRPVVSDSWFEDFKKMEMAEAGFSFGSAGKGEKLELLKSGTKPFVYFASIQKLRYDGGQANLAEFADVDWDLIIIDEAHEGTQTELAEHVMKAVRKERTKTLELSGTPFNLLDQYDESQVYTWDYTMEQTAKLKWSLEHPEKPNPYEGLPKVSMYTFEMKHKERYADESKSFNFREFLRVDGDNGELVHKEDVNAFLDNITNQNASSNYPFSTTQYRNELRHTLWLMPGVKEANAFEKLLCEHRIFGQEYKIVNVVKDDKSDTQEVATEGDLHKVRQAIGEDPSQTKTITLTVRKLTTGVNIPEWTAVLFLSNTNSAMNYLQAAFRAQTPFSHEKLGMKKNCYIFDFAPDRALSVMAESAQLNSGVGKKNTAEQKEAMMRLLNFMPILGSADTGMKTFNVDNMLTQLKKVYAEKAVRSGFEDDSLYNDRLLTLTEGDTEMFKQLNAIVGKTSKVRDREILISENGLTDAEYDSGEKALKKPRRQRTAEEEANIQKIREAKKQQKTMISILRGVSIRIPMMIYGMKLDLAQDIKIDDFVNQVDAESWKEFMPKGFTKQMFNEIAQYYDADVFVEAGRLIRQRAKSYDQLDFIERAEAIAELFGAFKNPDKETVLTPWRVVNLQLVKTLGGLNFYDNDFVSTTDGAVSNLHWVEQRDTAEVYKDDTKILDINTKTGLYPLHAAMSLYYKKIKENDDSHFDADESYKKILKENIYAIAKTPMAKTITERTLAGYRDFETNVQYIDGFVEAIKQSAADGEQKIEEAFDNVKFDVVIGNPPYQESTGTRELNSGQQMSVRNVFQDFQLVADKIASKYSVLIYPGKRWIHRSGKGMQSFGIEQINSPFLKKLYYYPNASELFSDVGINDGISVVLKDYTKKTKDFDYIYCENNKEIVVKISSPGEKLLILNPEDAEIVEKIESFVKLKDLRFLAKDIKPRSLFSIESNFVEHNQNKVESFNGQEFDKSKKVKLLTNDKSGSTGRQKWYLVDRDEIKTNNDLIDEWKVTVISANPGGQRRDSQLLIVDNYSAFGRARIALKTFKTEREAQNFFKYAQTYIIRFAFLMTDEALTSLAKKVPDLLDYTDGNKLINFDKNIDDQLIKLTKLTTEQFSYIKSQVDNLR